MHRKTIIENTFTPINALFSSSFKVVASILQISAPFDGDDDVTNCLF